MILGIIFCGVFLTSFDPKQLKKDVKQKSNLKKGIISAIGAVIVFMFWYPLWDQYISDKNWIGLVLVLRIFNSLVVLIYMLATKMKILVKDKEVFFWLIITGLLDAIACIAMTWGFGASTYTSVVTVLGSAFMVPTLVMARIFLKEKLTPLQWVGILGIVSGLICMGLVG